jgi:hypothetical protein
MKYEKMLFSYSFNWTFIYLSIETDIIRAAYLAGGGVVATAVGRRRR